MFYFIKGLSAFRIVRAMCQSRSVRLIFRMPLWQWKDCNWHFGVVQRNNGNRDENVMWFFKEHTPNNTIFGYAGNLKWKSRATFISIGFLMSRVFCTFARDDIRFENVLLIFMTIYWNGWRNIKQWEYHAIRNFMQWEYHAFRNILQYEYHAFRNILH